MAKFSKSSRSEQINIMSNFFYLFMFLKDTLQIFCTGTTENLVKLIYFSFNISKFYYGVPVGANSFPVSRNSSRTGFHQRKSQICLSKVIKPYTKYFRK